MHLARRSLCRRIDARTARGRGYKPRPQEPHPPHRSAVTGRRPSMGGMLVYVTEPVTNVKVSYPKTRQLDRPRSSSAMPWQTQRLTPTGSLRSPHPLQGGGERVALVRVGRALGIECRSAYLRLRRCRGRSEALALMLPSTAAPIRMPMPSATPTVISGRSSTSEETRLSALVP